MVQLRLRRRSIHCLWRRYEPASCVIVPTVSYDPGSFIPITLEQLAREQGVLVSDKTTSCRSTLKLPGPDLNITTHNLDTWTKPATGAGQCIVYILGAEVNTASFAMYTFSLSVLIQAFLIISISGLADHGRYRKTLLLAFAGVGSLTTMLFLAVTSRVYILAALLAVVANTASGASFVLLNSFLPLLVRYRPLVQSFNSQAHAITSALHVTSNERELEEESHNEECVNSTSALLDGCHENAADSDPGECALASPAMQESTRISSHGIAIGYLGAILVQALSVLIVVFTKGSTFSLRLVLFVVGAWWLVFTIPAAVWLRPRPGPPLEYVTGTTWIAYLRLAWVTLGWTITRARRLKDLFLFLCAWFLLSDAIATVSGTAVLFAKTSLGMKPAALALINVVVMISGVFGAFMWSKVSKLLRLKPIHTILACICVFLCVPLYALLGYIPAVQRLGYFGLQNAAEMYFVGALYGLVLGGLSSYCRALYGELIPPGSEATFYALYAITDKGSSIFGPAIVGAITDATGEIRPVRFRCQCFASY